MNDSDLSPLDRSGEGIPEESSPVNPSSFSSNKRSPTSPPSATPKAAPAPSATQQPLAESIHGGTSKANSQAFIFRVPTEDFVEAAGAGEDGSLCGKGSGELHPQTEISGGHQTFQYTREDLHQMATGIDQSPSGKPNDKENGPMNPSLPSPMPIQPQKEKRESKTGSDAQEEEEPNPLRPSKQDIVVLENVHKTYMLGIEGVPALRGVSVEIKKGEFVVILGKSGGGKTTMLNIIGTIDRPTKGNVWIAGTRISPTTPEKTLAAIRLSQLGFVFQTFNLISSLSALENVCLPMTLLGALDRPAVRKRAAALLSDVGLQERLRHMPNMMSGGEQQRTTIARALSNSPQILLLDEPTGDLDTRSSNVVMELLFQLNVQKKITMIMVTHDVALKRFAHRVIHMLDGKVARQERNKLAVRLEQYSKLRSALHGSPALPDWLLHELGGSLPPGSPSTWRRVSLQQDEGGEGGSPDSGDADLSPLGLNKSQREKLTEASPTRKIRNTLKEAEQEKDQDHAPAYCVRRRSSYGHGLAACMIDSQPATLGASFQAHGGKGQSRVRVARPPQTEQGTPPAINSLPQQPPQATIDAV